MHCHVRVSADVGAGLLPDAALALLSCVLGALRLTAASWSIVGGFCGYKSALGGG